MTESKNTPVNVTVIQCLEAKRRRTYLQCGLLSSACSRRREDVCSNQCCHGHVIYSAPPLSWSPSVERITFSLYFRRARETFSYDIVGNRKLHLLVLSLWSCWSLSLHFDLVFNTASWWLQLGYSDVSQIIKCFTVKFREVIHQVRECYLFFQQILFVQEQHYRWVLEPGIRNDRSE